MAGVDLGRVAYVPIGAYDALVTYNRLDVVSYLGSSWVSLIDNNTGNTPIAGVNWALVASKGDKGDKGDKGATGAQGVKGDTGAIGPQGPKGDTGPIGPQGVVGDTGAVGPQGPKGDTGAKGDKGDKGDTGATGATGPQGLKGDKGDKGDPGAVGPIGPKGDPGQNGVIPVDAPADGKTYGRKNEAWEEIKDGELSQDQMDAILDAFNAMPFDKAETTSITQDQMDTLINAIPSTLTKNVYHKVSYTSPRILPSAVTTIPIYSGYLGLDEDGQIVLIADFGFSDIYYAATGMPSTTGSTISIGPDLSITYIDRYLAFRILGTGEKALMDDGKYKKVFDPKNVTTVTTLTNLPVDNYSIKVTLSAASALSFASTPAEGWECMIDINNTGSADITQALPNAAGWQCDETSITIAAGKIASISVRYIHGTYVVLSKGN